MKLSSPHLSVESQAQNLYQYGEMLLKRGLVLTNKEAIAVIANKIDKMQKMEQISFVQALMIARRVLALYNQASSALSDDHSVKITRPDSPHPSSPTPPAYNPWTSNPREYNLAKGSRQPAAGQAFNVNDLLTLPPDKLFPLLETLPSHQRDEIETQIAIKRSLGP